MKQINVRQLTTAGMISALIFVLTMFKFDNVAGGYIHLGDSLVFFAALIVGPVYGFLAAGIGSMLADLLLGYPQYALITFFIKGIMTLIVFYGYTFLKGKKDTKFGKFGKIFFVSALASIFMIAAYFVAEIFLIGLGGAVADLPFNALQGAVSSVLSVVLIVPIETVVLYTNHSK